MDWMREQVKRGMNPRAYVLLGLLAVTLIYIQSLDDQQKRARARAHAAGAPAQVVVAAPVVKEGPSTPTELGWGRDPFDRHFASGGSPSAPALRGMRTPVAATGLWLQGVMNGPAGRTALINGEVYREGERIGSREVIQIGARSVLLMDHGTVTTLTLKGDGS